MDRHVVLLPHRPATAGRTSSPPRGARRGGRAVSRPVDRRWTWLFALGALLALAVAPSMGRAQGLRSPIAGVTLIVTKRADAGDEQRRASGVSSVEVRLPDAGALRGPVSLRLADGVGSASRLWIRDASGRLVRVTDRWVDVAQDGVLRFRVTEAPDAAAWRVRYRTVDGSESSLIVATPVSPVARR